MHSVTLMHRRQTLSSFSLAFFRLLETNCWHIICIHYLRLNHYSLRTYDKTTRLICVVKNWNLTRVFDQSAASGDLPELSHRVLPTGQNILGVFGEDCWADLSPIMRLLESGHTSVRDAVPQLDAAIFAACDIGVGSWVVTHTADSVSVLIQGVAWHKALECIDIIKSECWMLRAHQQEIPWWVEGDGA